MKAMVWLWFENPLETLFRIFPPTPQDLDPTIGEVEDGFGGRTVWSYYFGNPLETLYNLCSRFFFLLLLPGFY